MDDEQSNALVDDYFNEEPEASDVAEALASDLAPAWLSELAASPAAGDKTVEQLLCELRGLVRSLSRGLSDGEERVHPFGATNVCAVRAQAAHVFACVRAVLARHALALGDPSDSLARMRYLQSLRNKRQAKDTLQQMQQHLSDCRKQLCLSHGQPPVRRPSAFDIQRDCLEPLVAELKLASLVIDNTMSIYSETSALVIDVQFAPDFLTVQRVSLLEAHNAAATEARLLELLQRPSAANLDEFRAVVADIERFDRLSLRHSDIAALFADTVVAGLSAQSPALRVQPAPYGAHLSYLQLEERTYSARVSVEEADEHSRSDVGQAVRFVVQLCPPVLTSFAQANKLAAFSSSPNGQSSNSQSSHSQSSHSQSSHSQSSHSQSPHSQSSSSPIHCRTTLQSLVRGEREPVVRLYDGSELHFFETAFAGGDCPIVVSRVPCLRWQDVDQILNIVRQQVVWSQLYSTLFAARGPSDDAARLRRSVELQTLCPQQLVFASTATNGKLVSLHVRVDEAGAIHPSLVGGCAIPAPTLQALFDVTTSIPLILDRVLQLCV